MDFEDLVHAGHIDANTANGALNGQRVNTDGSYGIYRLAWIFIIVIYSRNDSVPLGLYHQRKP